VQTALFVSRTGIGELGFLFRQQPEEKLTPIFVGFLRQLATKMLDIKTGYGAVDH